MRSTGSYDGADLVVVNTCGFIDAAVEESLDAIGEALAENGKVIVTGCLGAKGNVVRETHPKRARRHRPARAGTKSWRRCMPTCRPQHDPFVDLVPPQGIRLTPDHYAYLKISEGCNHRCSFCIIPSLRGDLVSRPIGEVLQGSRNTGRCRRPGAADHLAGHQRLRCRCEIPHGLRRRQAGEDTALRTVQANSANWTSGCACITSIRIPSVDDLLPLMAEGKLLPYLDVPFQHASPRILKLMKRPGDVDKVLERIAAWRKAVPDLTIRSTFITGFPGETEAEFNELLDFLDAAQLDRVGAFAYSPVEGAAANALPGALPEAVREERKMRLMRHQEDISTQRLETKIGRRLTVLVDDIDDEGAIARSEGDAPDIDGLVYIADGHDLEIGEFAEVTITDCDVHDLYATLSDTPSAVP